MEIEKSYKMPGWDHKVNESSIVLMKRKFCYSSCVV